MLKMKNFNLFSLLRCLEQEMLIEGNTRKDVEKGRPKKRFSLHLWAEIFWALIGNKASSGSGLTKAVLTLALRDAQYTCRLVDKGLSKFEVFMELNTIAGNIKKSS
jgi:hypothetical protein